MIKIYRVERKGDPLTEEDFNKEGWNKCRQGFETLEEAESFIEEYQLPIEEWTISLHYCKGSRSIEPLETYFENLFQQSDINTPVISILKP